MLLHGDGGDTFFDFANQELQNGLMGVVILAPNDKRFWGGGGELSVSAAVLFLATWCFLFLVAHEDLTLSPSFCLFSSSRKLKD